MVDTSPARGAGLYYGWRVLGVTVTLAFFGSVTSQLFTGAMLPHIEAGTGWSRSSITFAVTLGTMTGGFFSPFFGGLSDRHGPRVLASAGVLIVALALLGMGLSGSVHVGLFYISYIAGRMIAQNTLAGVTAQTTAVNWFRRMRGRAMGLTQMALPLGGAALIPIAQLMISAGLGWQTVYFLFAGIMLVLLFPMAVLVLRRRPEDLGLRPDGDSEPVSQPGEPAVKLAPETGWTLRQAMRTRTLWLMIAAMAGGACANSAVSFHQLAYFNDQGLSLTVAALSLSLYALSGAVASGLWGFVIERVPERIVGAVTLAGAGLLSLYLLTVSTPVAAITFSVLYGLAARGESSIMSTMLAQYFGRSSFGTISGFTAPFQMLALGMGPTLAALLYDATGQSYTTAIVVAAVIFFVCTVCVILAKRPVLPDQTASPA